jgi:UTP:GlnB (protein PII) uridylyltransferase
MTAQKRDLSDPQVIEHFAEKVQDQTHLDYLYLLTCADISATNPQLWNTWRASLLRELYETTRNFLQKGPEGTLKFEKPIEGTIYLPTITEQIIKQVEKPRAMISSATGSRRGNDFIPDPSGRKDRHNQPIYIIK